MLQRMAPQSSIAHIGLSGGEGEREHKVRGVERWRPIWEEESREELGRRIGVNMVKIHSMMKFSKNYQKSHIF